jgi:hypothetical protein
MRQTYPYEELLQDILNFAADTLVLGGLSHNDGFLVLTRTTSGGRLLFWVAKSRDIPIAEVASVCVSCLVCCVAHYTAHAQFDADKELPTHPKMERLNVGLQECATLNRWLVLYLKCAE